MAKEFEINLFSEESYIQDLEKLKRSLDSLRQGFDKAQSAAQKGLQGQFNPQALERVKQTLNDIRAYEERIVRFQAENIKNLDVSRREREKYRDSLQKEIELLKQQRKLQDEIIKQAQSIKPGSSVDFNQIRSTFKANQVATARVENAMGGSSKADDLSQKLPRLLQLLTGKKSQVSQILGSETQQKKLDELVKSQLSVERSTQNDQKRLRQLSAFSGGTGGGSSLEQTLSKSNKIYEELIKIQKDFGKDLRQLINTEKGSKDKDAPVTRRDIQLFKEKLTRQEAIANELLSEEKKNKLKQLKETQGWDSLTDDQKRRSIENLESQYREKEKNLNSEFFRRREMLEGGEEYVNEGASGGGGGAALTAALSRFGVYGMLAAGAIKILSAGFDFGAEAWKQALEREELQRQMAATSKSKFTGIASMDAYSQLAEAKQEYRAATAAETRAIEAFYNGHEGYEMGDTGIIGSKDEHMSYVDEQMMNVGSALAHNAYSRNYTTYEHAVEDKPGIETDPTVVAAQERQDKAEAAYLEAQKLVKSQVADYDKWHKLGMDGNEAEKRGFQAHWIEPRTPTPYAEAYQLSKIERLGFDFNSTAQLAGKVEFMGERYTSSHLWHAINNTFLKASDTYAMMNKYIPMVQQLQNSLYNTKAVISGLESQQAIQTLRAFEVSLGYSGSVFNTSRADNAILSIDSSLRSTSNDYTESLKYRANEAAWKMYTDTYLPIYDKVNKGQKLTDEEKATYEMFKPIDKQIAKMVKLFGLDFSVYHNEMMKGMGISNLLGFTSLMGKVAGHENEGAIYTLLKSMGLGDDVIIPIMENMQNSDGKFRFFYPKNFSTKDNVSDDNLSTTTQQTLASWQDTKTLAGKPLLDITNKLCTYLQSLIDKITELVITLST